MTSQQFELSRRRLMQAVGLGAGAVATTSVLGACQAKGSEGEGASGKFVFVYPFDITVETYNAALNTGVLLTASAAAELFIPRSAILNWETQEWVPQLAESVTLDGTSLVIKLRSGLKWTDGTDVLAKDVAGTIYLQKLNAAQGTIGWDQLVSATADDDTTVTVTYTEAFTGVEHGALKAQVLPYPVTALGWTRPRAWSRPARSRAGRARWRSRRRSPPRTSSTRSSSPAAPTSSPRSARRSSRWRSTRTACSPTR